MEEEEEGQGEEEESSEGDLQHLMKSLDIAEHLHVLQVLHVHHMQCIQDIVYVVCGAQSVI